MNSPGVLCSLALLWAAAVMARRCGRRSTVAPKSILEEGGTPSEGNSSLSNMTKDCGMAIQGRVGGGYVVAPNDSPWTVALFLDDNFTSTRCSGSLVTDRHVVTAAHCVVNKTIENVIGASRFTVLVGEKDLRRRGENGSEMIGVTSVWPHEGFGIAMTMINDIAILVLSRPFTPDLSAALVCLPYALRGVNLTGRDVIVAGWGNLKKGGPQSDVLMAANLTIMSDRECSTSNTSNRVCATSVNGKRDACKGDSGGPLVTAGPPDGRMYLVGVVSGGLEGCGVSHFYGSYMRVTEFLDWIDARLKGRPPPGPTGV